MKSHASGTGDATARDGYANTGVHIGDVNLRTGAPVRTRYRHQVSRIAPAVLRDRETELAELADFCVAPDTEGCYRWWRAPAWSGKSALMSWFVLNPPPRVRIVSFFVTARLAGQSDRVAFARNVIEQLLSILDEELPPLLTESNQEAHLLGLLEDAARACRARGEHFVLLVDGLDEDRSSALGGRWHSIAGVLPQRPPEGMRVIVAGRPDPPIPDDVRPHHPLRDPGIVRHLAQSPHADEIRVDMERDLDDLLDGPEAGRELLGLVTAAGGGLTAADLAELTDQPSRDVLRVLSTATGRNFARRDGHSRSGDVYILGHEELQRTATELLGGKRLAGFRDRLHEWADRYRSLGWPAETPDFLLRGYFETLDRHGDVPRMVRCATDPGRQDRSLALSGGDTAALEEIAAAQGAVRQAAVFDMVAMARLVVHRDRLINRNATIPVKLPAVWAKLGQVRRAEALAGAITDPDRAVHAYAALAAVVPDDVASDHLDAAEALISSLEPARAVEALAALIPVVARVNGWPKAREHIDRAESLIQSEISPYAQVDAVIPLLRAVSAIGDRRTANRLTTAIKATKQYREENFIRLIRARVAAGDLFEAETLAMSPVGVNRSDWVRAHAASIIATAGDVPRAERIAGSLRLWGPHTGWALANVASANLVAGNVDHAERLVELVEHVGHRATAMTILARTAVETGKHDLAAALAVRAEEVSRSVQDPARRSRALALLAAAAGTSGDVDRMLLLAGLSVEVSKDVDEDLDMPASWSALVRAMVSAGQWRRARELAGVGEDLHLLVEEAADLGLLEIAEDLAAGLSDPYQQVYAMTSVAQAALRTGDIPLAQRITVRIIEQIDAVRSEIGHTGDRYRTLGLLFAISGEPDWMARVAQLIIGHADHYALMDEAAVVAAVPCDPRHAQAVFFSFSECTRQSALLVRDLLVCIEDRCDRRCADVVRDRTAALLSTMGVSPREALPKLEICVRVARGLSETGPFADDSVRSAVAQTFALLGDTSRAEELTVDVGDHARRDTAFTTIALVRAALGDRRGADSAARAVHDPLSQAQACLSLPYEPDREYIARVVDRVFHRDHWTGPLHVLAVTHPEAVAAMIDEMLAVEAHDFG
ncbi:hypothetical protein [Kibdelosporangium phytohabitans]|uniref:MOSC domain-containing protein n=1 Tax=Kibdelosporangium phytohabitans TaxID=860235 RepID=A0A0N7F4C4_9PSEU|nr:hypothetical protein [Kibdelosporangium phytohabitans]ALG11039.1 hypothetical protein AOZ06_32835 [Kibdelosporangium phytohabitans]MBE1462265.1 hypothetical protein [Kibdelosporangium phytohabitans]